MQLWTQVMIKRWLVQKELLSVWYSKFTMQLCCFVLVSSSLVLTKLEQIETIFSLGLIILKQRHSQRFYHFLNIFLVNILPCLCGLFGKDVEKKLDVIKFLILMNDINRDINKWFYQSLRHNEMLAYHPAL